MIDFDKGLSVSTRVLDALAVRAKVILHNIANQNTPGYKRYTVSFEERLRAAHEAQQDETEVYPVVSRDTSGPPGRNNVSPMEELAALEKVKLMQEIFTRRVGSYFQRLNKAIRGQS